MKRVLLLCMAALLLCAVLTACGMDGAKDGTTTTTAATRTDSTTTTTERRMDDILRDDGETVSEMFSEDFSELRDSSFLDPQNGIVSDTAPN